jgi:CBS domain-containing protein
MPVSEVATRQLEICAPDDTVRSAMATMRRAKVHRLPVVDSAGKLIGILSLRDVARAAGHRAGQIDVDEVVHTLNGICEPTCSAEKVPAIAAA